ncbi:reverse transcriptase domain-containing protein [Tanacetum coccineum]
MLEDFRPSFHARLLSSYNTPDWVTTKKRFGKSCDFILRKLTVHVLSAKRIVDAGVYLWSSGGWFIANNLSKGGSWSINITVGSLDTSSKTYVNDIDKISRGSYLFVDAEHCDRKKYLCDESFILSEKESGKIQWGVFYDKQLWTQDWGKNFLLELIGRLMHHARFIILFSDMNVMSELNQERFDSIFSRPEADQFYSFIDSTGLVNLPVGGRSYTWMIKARTKLSKLDRFLISEDVLEALLDIRITALGWLGSDHNPVTLHETEDRDMTMEEYIQYETEKALRNGKVYNWETATYGKIWYDEDVHYLRFFKTEFPAIIYNDALTSELEFSSKPIVNPQHVNEVNLKNKTSLSEYYDKEYNVISYNNLFPFNIFSIIDSKLDSNNDDGKIDIKQSSRDTSIKPLPNVISIDVDATARINGDDPRARDHKEDKAKDGRRDISYETNGISR